MNARHEPEQGRPVWQKLAWFIGLWLAGVLVLGLTAYALRFALGL